EPRKEIAKKAARERHDRGSVLRRQARQRLTSLGRRNAEVMEDRRRIRIAVVRLIPEHPQLSRPRVTGDECRLSRARRARNPNASASPVAVQKPKQTLSRQRVTNVGRSDLRKACHLCR